MDTPLKNFAKVDDLKVLALERVLLQEDQKLHRVVGVADE